MEIYNGLYGPRTSDRTNRPFEIKGNNMAARTQLPQTRYVTASATRAQASARAETSTLRLILRQERPSQTPPPPLSQRQVSFLLTEASSQETTSFENVIATLQELQPSLNRDALQTFLRAYSHVSSQGQGELLREFLHTILYPLMETLPSHEAELLVPLEDDSRELLTTLLPREDIDAFLAAYEEAEEDLSSLAEEFAESLEEKEERQDAALLERANAQNAEMQAAYESLQARMQRLATPPHVPETALRQGLETARQNLNTTVRKVNESAPRINGATASLRKSAKKTQGILQKTRPKTAKKS